MPGGMSPAEITAATRATTSEASSEPSQDLSQAPGPFNIFSAEGLKQNALPLILGGIATAATGGLAAPIVLGMLGQRAGMMGQAARKDFEFKRQTFTDMLKAGIEKGDPEAFQQMLAIPEIQKGMKTYGITEAEQKAALALTNLTATRARIGAEIAENQTKAASQRDIGRAISEVAPVPFGQRTPTQLGVNMPDAARAASNTEAAGVARRGQDVDARGQDIQAAVAREGHTIQREQNRIQAADSRARAKHYDDLWASNIGDIAQRAGTPFVSTSRVMKKIRDNITDFTPAEEALVAQLGADGTSVKMMSANLTEASRAYSEAQKIHKEITTKTESARIPGDPEYLSKIKAMNTEEARGVTAEAAARGWTPDRQQEELRKRLRFVSIKPGRIYGTRKQLMTIDEAMKEPPGTVYPPPEEVLDLMRNSGASAVVLPPEAQAFVNEFSAPQMPAEARAAGRPVLPGWPGYSPAENLEPRSLSSMWTDRSTSLLSMPGEIIRGGRERP